jgi:hypothetical protein
MRVEVCAVVLMLFTALVKHGHCTAVYVRGDTCISGNHIKDPVTHPVEAAAQINDIIGDVFEARPAMPSHYCSEIMRGAAFYRYGTGCYTSMSFGPQPNAPLDYVEYDSINISAYNTTTNTDDRITALVDSCVALCAQLHGPNCAGAHIISQINVDVNRQHIFCFPRPNDLFASACGTSNALQDEVITYYDSPVITSSPTVTAKTWRPTTSPSIAPTTPPIYAPTFLPSTPPTATEPTVTGATFRPTRATTRTPSTVTPTPGPTRTPTTLAPTASPTSGPTPSLENMLYFRVPGVDTTGLYDGCAATRTNSTALALFKRELNSTIATLMYTEAISLVSVADPLEHTFPWVNELLAATRLDVCTPSAGELVITFSIPFWPLNTSSDMNRVDRNCSWEHAGHCHADGPLLRQGKCYPPNPGRGDPLHTGPLHPELIAANVTANYCYDPTGDVFVACVNCTNTRVYTTADAILVWAAASLGVAAVPSKTHFFLENGRTTLGEYHATHQARLALAVEDSDHDDTGTAGHVVGGVVGAIAVVGVGVLAYTHYHRNGETREGRW